VVEDCAFCVEVEEGLSFDPVLNSLGAPRLPRILGENAEFIVLPSLGPLVDDHLLIVTKKHVPNFRSAGAALRSNLLSATGQLAEKMVLRSGRTALVFENGSQLYRLGCVDHLHFHVLTLPAIIADRVLKRFSTDDLLSTAEMVAAPIRMDCDYVVLKIGIAQEWAMMTRPEIDRQLVRRLIAEEQGSPAGWNWRDAPNLDAVRLMVGELGPVVESAGFRRTTT